MSELLACPGVVPDQSAVRPSAVHARDVLRCLGLDLVLQIDSGHLGQAEQLRRQARLVEPIQQAGLALVPGAQLAEPLS